MSVRTRFSPSPTGMIHIGNARAALFSALYATENKGAFVLRIEDTDAARSEDRYIESLQQDLHWLGINWQEGPGTQDKFGPYLQSLRQNVYDKYYKILEDNQLIYPCFCTDQELAVARKIQLSRGLAPRYAGTCRKLSAEEVVQKIAAGEKPSWRFIIPNNTAIEFNDVVKGPQCFNSDDIGDFIVRRADGTAPFLFCNAVDDAEMKISHVLRGEDHLSNTPRQVLILKALKLPIPTYGHLSMIVGEDGTPLSKRHGSFSVTQLQEDGYLPVAIINYLSRLGHTCDVQELLSFEQLAPHFRLEKLSRSPARFDISQLNYWQKIAVQALDANSVMRWVGEQVMNHVPASQQALFAETMRANILFPKEAAEWATILFHDHAPIDAEKAQIIREAGEQFFVEAELAVDKFGLDLPAILAEMKKTLNVSGKKLFMPLRIALTGQLHGPELPNIVELLGLKKMKHRLSHAFKLASEK